MWCHSPVLLWRTETGLYDSDDSECDPDPPDKILFANHYDKEKLVSGHTSARKAARREAM